MCSIFHKKLGLLVAFEVLMYTFNLLEKNCTRCTLAYVSKRLRHRTDLVSSSKVCNTSTFIRINGSMAICLAVSIAKATLTTLHANEFVCLSKLQLLCYMMYRVSHSEQWKQLHANLLFEERYLADESWLSGCSFVQISAICQRPWHMWASNQLMRLQWDCNIIALIAPSHSDRMSAWTKSNLVWLRHLHNCHKCRGIRELSLHCEDHVNIWKRVAGAQGLWLAVHLTEILGRGYDPADHFSFWTLHENLQTLLGTSLQILL